MPGRWGPRNLAARLGVDRLGAAQSVYRAAASVRYSTRGFRYGHAIAEPTRRPQDAPDSIGDLEAYANGYVEGPGLNKWQHYYSVYERHLDRFRGRPVHVVEVGIFAGGSLGMWRAFLGPDINVSGIDIDPSCRKHEASGIRVFIGDQADPAFWRSFLAQAPPIDIVIDDGGHQAEQQIPTLEALLPHVAPGGVYVVEDIHGPFHPFHSYVDGLTRPLHAIGHQTESNEPSALQQHVASVHRYPLMTVIEKPSFVRPRFESPVRGTEWPDSSPFYRDVVLRGRAEERRVGST